MELELYTSALNNPNVNPALIPYLTNKIEEMIPGAAGTKSTRGNKPKSGKKGAGGMLSGLVSGLQESFGMGKTEPASAPPLPQNTLLTPDEQNKRTLALKQGESDIEQNRQIAVEKQKQLGEKDQPVGSAYTTAKDAAQPWLGFKRVSKTKGGGEVTLDENAIPSGILGEQYFQSQALRQIDPNLSPQDAWNKVQENYRRTQLFGKSYSSKEEEIHNIHPDWTPARVAGEVAKQADEQQKLKTKNLKSLLESRQLSIQTKQLLLGQNVTGLSASDKREFDMKTSVDRNIVSTLSSKLKNFGELTEDEKSSMDRSIQSVEAVRNEILQRKKGSAAGGAKPLPKELADRIQEGTKAHLSDGTTWQKKNGVVSQVVQ